MEKTLSILIPANNEEFLIRTIEDILEHIEGDTDIIVGLDGAWANKPIPQHPRVSALFYPESIGQRAMTNQLCQVSQAKYVMKVDAHCSFDQGFDVKLMNEMKDDWTMIPTMKNLHAFDWVCDCGFSHYQDKGSTCTMCSGDMVKKMVWHAKRNPKSNSFRFDSEPHFQYFNQYPHRHGELTETMSIQGSCFMVTRKKYLELNICDEALGSWGSQGIEVACKTWLSGGRVVVNQKTWYAHMFRTKPQNGFGFPYKKSEAQSDHAKRTVLTPFKEGTWPLQKRPLSWLLEKFWPIPGWTQEQLDEIKKLEK